MAKKKAKVKKYRGGQSLARNKAIPKALRAIMDQQAKDAKWREDHERHDDKRFEEGTKLMSSLATAESVEKLHKLLVDDDGTPRFATKRDVAPLLKFYNNIILSAQITEGAGKWISRTILWLAGFLIAMGIITGGFKAAVAGLLAWVTPK